jgi:hypothetical protein
MAVTIIFIAAIVINSSMLTDRSSPSMQFFVSLIAFSNTPMMTGKLSTAIITLLLIVFEAMADSSDSDAEKPYDASINVRRNRGTSWIGFESTILKNKNPRKQIAQHNKNPYRILEMIISVGDARLYI